MDRDVFNRWVHIVEKSTTHDLSVDETLFLKDHISISELIKQVLALAFNVRVKIDLQGKMLRIDNEKYYLCEHIIMAVHAAIRFGLIDVGHRVFQNMKFRIPEGYAS
ncbi:MAG TPA: hypothetical protein VI432_03055 [Candidatus Paceibacterota bacterium]